MKKFTLLTKLLAFILVLNLSCSTDSIETNEADIASFNDSDQTTLHREGPCDGLTTFVFVEYNFVVPGTNIGYPSFMHKQLKEDFRSEMSKYFSICEVTPSSCDYYERWTVPHSEFWNYWQPGLGQGSGVGQIRPTGGQQENLNCVF